MMWSIKGQPPCLKWENNKEFSPFQNLPWDQLRPLLQLHHSASLRLSIFFYSLTGIVPENTPQKALCTQISETQNLSPRELDQRQHLSLVPPHPHVVLFSPHSSTPKNSKFSKTMPQIPSPPPWLPVWYRVTAYLSSGSFETWPVSILVTILLVLTSTVYSSIQ